MNEPQKITTDFEGKLIFTRLHLLLKHHPRLCGFIFLRLLSAFLVTLPPL